MRQPSLSVVHLARLAEREKAAIVRLCAEALDTDCSSLFGYLSDSTHLLIHVEGRLVGHACWTTRRLRPAGSGPLRTAWVDTVTIDPAHQRRGMGTALMRRVAKLTATFELGALGTERIGFFARLGWESWHGPTADVLHDPLDTLMIRRTAWTPSLDLGALIRAE